MTPALEPEFGLVTPDGPLLDRLRPVARRIFTDTFSALYDAGAFSLFCDQVYGSSGSMARDFDAPDVLWQVAVADGAPIGYAKVTSLRAPTADAPADSLELQQIYVLADWHGRGVAEALMTWALAAAVEAGAPAIYLTVFDHNARAKRFYTRHGFEEVGRCTFTLGDRVDDDRVWRKILRP